MSSEPTPVPLPAEPAVDSGAIIAMAFAGAAFLLSGFIPIGFVPGIVAIVTARRSLARIAASDGALAGRRVDLVAIALAAVGSIASVVFLVLVVVRS